MPVSEDAMHELRQVCPGAQEMVEAGISYIYLPGLKHPSAPGSLDGLLCPQLYGGYTTRLFLSAAVPGKGSNWSTHTILGRLWHTWSWNNVPANQRPAEMLAQHLRALR